MGTLFDSIVRTSRNDPATLPLRSALRFFSILFGAGVKARAALVRRGTLSTGRVPCRVAAVGALAAGGTGKTPVAIMTARLLAQTGRRVAVVSRGYRREGSGVRVVSDFSGILLSPREAGDEPHLIAATLPGVPVVVGERRAGAAALAYERFRPDIILLDDGFQHIRLHRDIDVVTLDSRFPFGNGFLLPRGLLRERPEALARAHAAVFTRFDDDCDRKGLADLVRAYNPRIDVFFERHSPSGIRNPADGTVADPGSLHGMRVAALSNIADPDSFHRLIESLGASIVLRTVMPDHHRHTSDELARIARDAESAGASCIVATAKDEHAMPAPIPAMIRILDMEAVLVEGEDRYSEIITGAAD